jgi:hypothetical protein
MLRRTLLPVALLVVAGLVALTFVPPPGPRSLKAFDPDRVADLEVDIWQAYYKQERLRLFRGLLTLLREQNRYSWARATQQAFYFATAASTFATANGDYERVVPDLTKGFAVMRAWTGASFDPEAVAKAELAWWVARRVPGQDAPAHVGRLMAQVNAQSYVHRGGPNRGAILEAHVVGRELDHRLREIRLVRLPVGFGLGNHGGDLARRHHGARRGGIRRRLLCECDGRRGDQDESGKSSTHVASRGGHCSVLVGSYCTARCT